MILLFIGIIASLFFSCGSSRELSSGDDNDPYGKVDVDDPWALERFGKARVDNTAFAFKHFEFSRNDKDKNFQMICWVINHDFYGQLQYFAVRLATERGISYYLQKGGYDYPIEVVTGEQIEKGSKKIGEIKYGEPQYIIYPPKYDIYQY
ncbi:MAG: hypothetical protein GY839_01690 [candidate division Zixibacteria bacterium]|nr:hypothetical protein [candidate division Zixibacteria bacterium]